MKRATAWIVVALVVAAGVLGLDHVLREPEPVPVRGPVPAAVGEVEPMLPPAFGEPGTVPPIRFPIEGVAPDVGLPDLPVLPTLEESDRTLHEALGGLFEKGGNSGILLLEDLIRRVVVTVDNLPRERVSRRLAPIKPASGQLLTTGRGDQLAVSPHNAARYTPYVVLAEGVDLRYLVALYVRFYPLFQQAFEDLGYPEGYFNDRVVAVIDHLLATPRVEGPVRLIQPKVLYEFADPELERRSAGQKFLIRMGPENAERIKARLRELRQLLVAEEAEVARSQ